MLQSISSYSARHICLKVPSRRYNLSAYTYGFTLLYSSIFTSMLLLLISLIMRRPFHLMMFMLFFIPIRTCSGGYHCKTYIKCTVVSCLCFILTFLVSLMLKLLPVAAALLLTGLIAAYIYRNSPVQNSKQILTAEAVLKNRKKAKWILLLNFLAIAFLYMTPYFFIAPMGIATLITVAVLMHIVIHPVGH